MAKQRENTNVVDMIEPAPKRYNISREAWARTPEIVRSEILRAQRELEAGIAKYRPASERYNELAEFHELAEASGTTVAAAFHRYFNMEQLLRSDFDAGIDAIMRNVGIDPIDYATVIAAGVELAHGAFLKAAADAIRREPRRNWNGLQFGYMAHEVQRVRPDCVAMQPNGYLAVDYGRLLETPEASALPLYSYRYIDGVEDLESPQVA